MKAITMPMPVVQQTTVKDEPLQLQRVPSGEPCVLNYQQANPELEIRNRVWLRVLFLAVLTNTLLAMLLSSAKKIPGLVAVVTWAMVLLSVFGVVVMARRIAIVATRWLTAAPQIDPSTLEKFRNAWIDFDMDTWTIWKLIARAKTVPS